MPQWDRESDNARPRVAVVIHRYLPSCGGGAEEHCRRLVEGLVSSWEIDVLTTCARDHHSWANELPAGIEEAGGYRIRRFPTRAPKRRLLSALLARALPRLPHPDAAERLWLRALGPDCPLLLESIARERESYRLWIFYTYLYPTTVLGIHLAGPRTLLVPTAHDEPALRLAAQRRAITGAGALAFLTPEEEALVRSVCGPIEASTMVLGGELDPQAWVPGDAEAFRRRHGIEGPFLFYLGRVERSKGLEELFALYRNRALYGNRPSELPPLVLAGHRGPLRVPAAVRHVGFLSEEEKRGALAACSALVMPSVRESLSIAVLEAWAQRRPVIVSERSPVLVGQCRRSGGGVSYRDEGEFLAACAAAGAGAGDPARASELGEAGFRYAQAHCGAGAMRDRLEPFVDRLGWLADERAPAGVER